MDTITAPGASAKKPGLLINRDFALLFSGQAVSIIGDMLFNTTLTIWIATVLAKGQSWAPLAVSAVLLGASVPVFLVGPFAGVFIDRANRRRMMLWMDGLRTIVIALMILFTGAMALPFLPGGRLPVGWTLGVIYVTVFVINAAEQFFRPASMAMIQMIVPEEQQAKAMGLSQVSLSLAVVIGPAVAAPLFVTFGPQWALLANALSFATSYLTILLIRSSGSPVAQAANPQRAGFLSEFWEGVRFYFSNRVLVTLTIAVIVAVLGASALNTLDIFFTTRNLGASTTVYGFVGAVYGLGSIIGSVALPAFAERIGLARLLWSSLALMGVLVMILSRLTSVGPALSFMLAIGFFNAALNIAASPLMMRATPSHMMGRAMSIFQPAMNLSILVSTALIGYLASVTLRDFHATFAGAHFGAVDTIWLVGGAIIALSAIIVAIGLWGVDRRARETRAIASAQHAQVERELAAPLG
ncbi:MAG TPA: MFS transporter [Ktedonobacterales bacterium]